MTLGGNVAVVFGGSRGVGRACAALLAERGADVAVVCRSNLREAEVTAQAVRAAGRRAHVVQCDIADDAQVAAAYREVREALGPFRLLVSSAGVTTAFTPVRELSPAQWRAYVAVDLTGTFHILHHGAPYLEAAGGGCVVVVSSIASQMVPARNAHGAAAKAGVDALVRVFAKEEARRGIRANVVGIGLTETEMGARAVESWHPDTLKRVVAGIPLGRIATPEDVARSVVFLLGDEASYITGKVLQVDGGQFIGG
ncbi:SDR family NAD(P)-dependent oxidoreductase [Ramlibacter sp.]|uniref:SDR family NAD(P)-dependent oxidoreductase n=1 Tax=Ramlibacter sp. TaxID=1917967 RepID=UPI003D1185AA